VYFSLGYVMERPAGVGDREREFERPFRLRRPEALAMSLDLDNFLFAIEFTVGASIYACLDLYK